MTIRSGKTTVGEKFNDFVNICLECAGTGGNAGNIFHAETCEFQDCQHTTIRRQSLDNSNGGFWGLTQPNVLTREKHQLFMKTKKDEIELARRKMMRNLTYKMYALLEIKTGVSLDQSIKTKKWLKIITGKTPK